MPENNEVLRVKPHSLEAEMSVIGSMIMDKEAINKARDILKADDFYSRQYEIMFTTIAEIDDKGLAVDPVTLQDKLKEKNLPVEMYAADTIGEIINQVPTSANVESYAKIVAEKSSLRKLIRINEELAKLAYEEHTPSEELLKKAETEVFRLSQTRSTFEMVPIRKIVVNAMDKIVAASRNKGPLTGLSTGFTDLDTRTAGLQPSDFLLIAARPSMGKTAFALNIAENAAVKNNKHVAIFSLEMSKEQLTNRLFSMESRVDAQKIRIGDMSEAEWSDLIEGAGIIGNSGLILDDTPAISASELRSRCLKYKMEYGLDLVMIDYLQLMSGSSSKSSESRQQEVSDISRSLKALAREINVPIIALSQLSRAVEQRPNKRPMLSDLRESGAIEQDADVVMFIYRDDYYNKDTEDKGIAEIIIAKQRNGPVGTVQLRWLPEYTKFTNLAGPSQGQDGQGASFG